MSTSPFHSDISTKSSLGMLRLLVIEQRDSEAEAIEEVLESHMVMHRVPCLATAARMLRKQSFEIILMNEAVPGDQRGALLDFIRRITLDVPVVIYTSREDEAVVLDTMKAGASDCIRQADGQQHLSRLPAAIQDAVARNRQRQREQERLHEEAYNHMMETLRASVAKVTHDINNPLAIISGNAQLLSELGRYMDLDDEIIKPIKDIEEASTRIASSLHRLASLKDLMLHEKAQGDGSLADLDEGIFSPDEPVPVPGTAPPPTA